MANLKILCIVDSYEWALANRANAIKKYLKNDIVDIIYFNDIKFKHISFDDYDIVYVLNWPIHGYIYNKISKRKKYKLVTTVSSHIGQPKDNVFFKILEQYDAVSTSNMMLYKDFKNKFKNLNIHYTPFGVDLDVFSRVTEPSKYSSVFGWVGNHTRDVKRFDKIKRVFDSLENHNIELKIVTQGSGLSRDDMSKFYNKIGTIICFSSSEGTPNPVLEAAACGRNVLSTPVGNIPELLYDSNIPTINSEEQLRNFVLLYCNNPEVVKVNGDFLFQQAINKWGWNTQINNFKKFLGV